MQHILDCLFCFSNKIKKYGLAEAWGQRYKCNDCNHTFSLGGKRWTYDTQFKHRVTENYCHKGLTAQEVVKHYGISTRTLINWSKDHKGTCPLCTH